MSTLYTFYIWVVSPLVLLQQQTKQNEKTLHCTIVLIFFCKLHCTIVISLFVIMFQNHFFHTILSSFFYEMSNLLIIAKNIYVHVWVISYSLTIVDWLRTNLQKNLEVIKSWCIMSFFHQRFYSMFSVLSAYMSIYYNTLD